MVLTSRITLTGPNIKDATEDAEDILADALGIVFPDDVMIQHGDDAHGLSYTSPHLPKPLLLSLADPDGEDDRRLFSHYLWNSSLLLAELLEAGTLFDAMPPANPNPSSVVSSFNVAGLSIVELGAGTALPSLLAGLLGAEKVVITDYPAPAVLKALHDNVKRNLQPSFSPLGSVAQVTVEGHSWGDISTPLAQGHRHLFDRVFVCDCLWMPWQHANLHRSIVWFLKNDRGSRCWVVSGLHTNRAKMHSFFDPPVLAAVDLVVETIWEQDCDGRERPWVEDRGVEDVRERKRWLVVAVLRRMIEAEGRGEG